MADRYTTQDAIDRVLKLSDTVQKAIYLVLRKKFRPPRFMTITEAARYMDVSRATIYAWLKHKHLKQVNLPDVYGGKTMRKIMRSDLDNLVERCSDDDLIDLDHSAA